MGILKIRKGGPPQRKQMVDNVHNILDGAGHKLFVEFILGGYHLYMKVCVYMM